MRTLPLTSLTAALALTAACGGSSAPGPYVPPVPFDQPIVAMRDVRLAGAGLTGGSMDIVVSVYNPNDYAVQTPRMTRSEERRGGKGGRSRGWRELYERG